MATHKIIEIALYNAFGPKLATALGEIKNLNVECNKRRQKRLRKTKIQIKSELVQFNVFYRCFSTFNSLYSTDCVRVSSHHSLKHPKHLILTA